ncbi:MAG TPA: TetR/AcrR family transcriptional regulator [Chthonomonadaceae bacterium]|nr:TetR/AcrR family transcriptional regulator [Chthonomonadaceae bacterium]
MCKGPGSREKILSCARDLFYIVGYQTTSVDDILRISGVAKSNFYYHFRTKDDLAIAVLELQMAEFERTAVQALADGVTDPRERLEAFCAAIIRAQAEIHRMGGCPFGNFAAALSIHEGDASAERFRAVLCGVFDQIQCRLEACLQAGIESGVFRSDVPTEELAATVLGAIEGLLLMTRTQRCTTPLARGLPALQLMLRVG